MIWRKAHLGITAALAMLFLGAATAAAQEPLWLEPAYADRPVLGPGKAAGAVIWSHGRSIASEDFEAETPPYIGPLSDAGWDAFRFNRRRDADALRSSARMLTVEAQRLKQEGYRQVVLAGQSFGAFLSLMAADASDDVDAVIATAPAAYGSFTDFYDSWHNNATRLYPLLERVRRARVMVFYFHGDDFDPGGRGERSRDILLARKLPFIVVDQPPTLTSHWAAGSQEFADLFGSCILEFLETPVLGSDARCDAGTLVAGPVDAAPEQNAARAALPAHRVALNGGH